VKHPEPRAWTSAQAMGPSSQTPGFAPVTQAGPDMTVPSVNVGRRACVVEGGVTHSILIGGVALLPAA
jgi:hypothetical protein